MSVHNLGVNYVCVPEKAEPADDEADYGPSGPQERGPFETECRKCGRLAFEHAQGKTSIYGVCPPALPARIGAWEIDSPPAVAEPIKPSDVRDGDLLTLARMDEWGQVWTTPDALVQMLGGRVWIVTEGGRFKHPVSVGEDWLDGLSVSSRKPAPAPSLPWEEHPDAFWQREDGIEAYQSRALDSSDEPAEWQRVAVIPWDLIENLRRSERATTGDTPILVQAILDAAAGATS